MKMLFLLRIIVLLLAAWVTTNASAAPVYQPGPIMHTGGGGQSFDSRFKITGSIGQPLVNLSIGGSFRASSGFWPPGALRVDGCLQLICPTNLVASCQTPNGAVVNYPVLATNRCNPGDLSVTCDRPSGSFFPIGTTRVNCVAVGSGQTSSCSFDVSVVPLLRSRDTITITWDCGVLEAADHPEGPYLAVTGATSPYVADPSFGRRFFRVRKP